MGKDHRRLGGAIGILLSLLSGVLPIDRAVARADSTALRPDSERAYSEMLARIQHGDMTVDFGAFRIAGALRAASLPQDWSAPLRQCARASEPSGVHWAVWAR